jgi:serine/threonine-protein kinase
MAGNPQVLGLLEEMLDSGKSPEEMCRDCPELLPEVRRRWQAFCVINAQVGALFPGLQIPGAAGSVAPAPPAAALPQVPGYEVEAVLGQGGMGVVYRARQRALNRSVAIKMLIAGPFAGPQELARFRRETAALACLRHPNVVQVFDAGAVDGRPYFSMELVEGGTLAQKLAGTPQPAHQAAALVATLAAAVELAHRAGIVHRDLKPSNVLLTTDGTPKISDFGLARRKGDETDLTRTGAALGTPSYMAPEQAQCRTDAVGPATDVYALGAILYETLTGRPPFRAVTAAETLQQVISQDPVAPSRLSANVPRDLETVCLKCLHKEPPRRYTTAAALAEDLHHFLQGEAIAARPERWVGRLARRVRRRPVMSGAVAAGTLVTVALAGGGMWLIADRVVTARETAAERTAVERAADEDLREMVRWLNRSFWPEARVALERARGRLGDHGSAELLRRLDQGASDLELATRLEAIQLDLARDALRPTPGQADRLYEETFRGVGQITDDPGAVAARIRDSDIRTALVAALDHWSAETRDPHRRRWVLTVARLVDTDPDPTGWRARARDPDVRETPAALTEVIRTAPSDDQPTQLLLALAKQSKFDSPERLPLLRRIQQAHPGDFWANLELADVYEKRNQAGEAIRFYQAAVAIRPQVAVGHLRLGHYLCSIGRVEEGVECSRRAVDLDRTAVTPRLELADSLEVLGRYDEAIHHFQAAVHLQPDRAQLRVFLGDSLEVRGRHDEALDQYRRAVALTPKDPFARNKLRSVLVRQGRGEEERTAWQTALDADPPDHDAWDGYAEFCLFLGREDEYRRARRALLGKFGATTDPRVAERIAHAGLLLPATEDELRQAAALAERAAAVERSKYQGEYVAFLLTRCLADYRRGGSLGEEVPSARREGFGGVRFDRAIATIRGERLLGLGPARLIFAMALHRSGRVEEAREVLATAIESHDWKPGRVTNRHDWIWHVLRREAEALIVPELPAFLAGEYRPRDNNERLTLTGVCQFTNRTLALARLYTDMFAADRDLAEDFRSGRRYTAARAAALVGCGWGADVADVGEPERARWRQQARQWLRADLAAWSQALDRDPVATRGPVWRVMKWRGDPYLSGFFEPAELEKLPPDERKDCVALSNEIGRLLTRAGSVAPKRTDP